jgi:purine-binding chemotaxis protein CheW
MGKVNGKFVILIDTGKVLSLDEMAQLNELAQPQARLPQGNLQPS